MKHKFALDVLSNKVGGRYYFDSYELALDFYSSVVKLNCKASLNQLTINGNYHTILVSE